MDSITQAALGAAVGELVLGRKVGAKAAAWGAALGTLPDLDILANPFLNEMQELAFHRGITHALVFPFVMAPLLGWLLARLHPRGGATRRAWSWLAFWVLLTHPLLDAFTVYGTQLFQPFSDYPVSFSSIFIIDPFYTLPLLLGVVTALFLRRTARSRLVVNALGLGLSSLYLLFTVTVKMHVERVFAGSLRAEGIRYEQLLTTPTPLNAVLWTGLAQDEDTIWVGLYSVFDGSREIPFRRVEKNRAVIASNLEQPALQRLLWFSRGFYSISRQGGSLFFHDLRFVRTDLWLTEEGAYPFTFRLLYGPGTPLRIVGFRQEAPSFDLDARTWRRLLTRVKGQ